MSMSSPLTASEAGLCRLAAIVTAERADLPACGLPLSLLSDLRDQIPCDFVQFQGFDSGRRDEWFVQAVRTTATTGRRTRIWVRRTGSITGTVSPAVTRTAVATFAAS